MTTPTYRLAVPGSPGRPPTLDPDQQRVVDHPGGPLLVLAGPGTGKTTTLVEAIVDRIETRGADPGSVLALTFSRKAAEQLRDRISARIERTTSATISATFHSFAYGLVRRFAPPDLYAEPLRLLSAPEQDVVLQQLLTDAPESVRWPDGFRAAVGTRGFAREVQNALARARERGLESEDLRRLGETEDRPALVAAGWFLEQYLEVLDNESAIDYADLISRAVLVAREHRDELRAQYRYVFVDEYQDTDPAQVALLRALAGDGRDLVVVGDPDQSIYGFRGADVRGILDFPAAFPQSDGSKAEVVALRTTRRFGTRMATATHRIASSIAMSGSIDLATFQAFRTPATDPGTPAGLVEVRTHDTARAETEHIADLLRRAHLEDEVPWSQMAVLVRSGRTSLPALRRSLAGAGVPVDVASDDTPLVREPALQPLLDALRIVAAGDTDDRAVGLLQSPLGGLDAIEVRRLARALRTREKAEAEADGRSPRSSAELLRAAVLDPDLVAAGDPGVERVRALTGLLAAARAELAAGATADEVLWTLWSGTGWPERLRRACAGGGAAARLAHRDLDAVCALFEAAARAEGHRVHTSVQSFLDTLIAQEIPGDTLADRGVRGEGVRLLTAHRSKGLEWDLVVVASVQEQTWPDLRRRFSLLEADRLAAGELLDPITTSAMLAEERRLFYVACTRARRRLVVTAVASPEDDGDQPSRFLRELGVEPVASVGRPDRPLSLAGLVADLRRTVADPATSEPLRAAAAIRLAALADERIGERPLVPQADPARWWGTRAPSRAPAPIRDPDAPLRLSASDLESIDQCGAKWFLEKEAGGTTYSTSAQGVGLIVHALADRIGRGELPAEPGDQDALMAYVDQVWDQIDFRTPWAKGREHDAVRLGLSRFVDWHLGVRGRTLVSTEQRFVTRIDLPDGERVELRGFADRLEVDADGRLVVVDLKTGKYAPTGPGVKEHIQLGLYQYAANHGAFADVAGDVSCAGAELVQLRASTTPAAKVQTQAADDAGHTGIEERLTEVAGMIRAEEFTASSGDHCRYCDFQSICPVKGSGTVFDR
ncbi:ATP-dependent helicase [Nocardioides marmoriginsengisoli]|uniref:DNA 3'-5' helicase n=1 Tax=Nocardioides marmoriginsengisoli TaxID=661483 RepID=A0A3N0CC53_9ACTN|nr:ATP-dependent DNA helicase [Nocardioides marmoriginsengisoli]RNL61014.1 ATP-dependent helicase [Nocardioides marmoriginsengisoli]